MKFYHQHCGHPADGLLNPKFGLDVETNNHTHSPRGYEKLYYSHNETFWSELGKSPGRFKNDLTGLAFIVLRV